MDHHVIFRPSGELYRILQRHVVLDYPLHDGGPDLGRPIVIRAQRRFQAGAQIRRHFIGPAALKRRGLHLVEAANV